MPSSHLAIACRKQQGSRGWQRKLQQQQQQQPARKAAAAAAAADKHLRLVNSPAM
jgi:hypothetical protein